MSIGLLGVPKPSLSERSAYRSQRRAGNVFLVTCLHCLSAGGTGDRSRFNLRVDLRTSCSSQRTHGA
jgi:hypothetical protein